MTTSRPDWHFVRAHPAHFLAFGLGTGLSPWAPGTAGTLAALPVFFFMQGLPALIYWGGVLATFLVGVWVCERTGRALGVDDHGGIVWDEIVAFLMVLPFAPPTWWGYGLAFVLFRLFDIWKPFPIRWFDEHVHGGFGVMLDDVLAAGYAVLCLWGVTAWIR
jgi:phosphatidylglycerophosphatase A